MTAPAEPAAPSAPAEPVPKKKRTSGTFWAIFAAVVLTIAAVWLNQLNQSSIEMMRGFNDHTYQTRVMDKVLSAPGAKAFHDDPVLQGPEWAAVNDLNRATDAEAQKTVLEGMGAAKVFLLSASSMREGQAIIDDYRARESSTKDVNFLIVKTMVDEACKASSPAETAASWNVKGAIRYPLTGGVDASSDPAVKKVLEDGVRAAMTAGVRHICP